MQHFIQSVNGFLWGIGTFGLIGALGASLWWRTGWLPLRGFWSALKLLLKPEKGTGVSGVGALCTSLAASLGTGNIIGVAAAMAVGGPGALFWMQVSALLGMAIKYAEGYLGAVYRRKGKVGGPFCYLEQGVGKPRLAGLYAVACTVGCLLSLGTTSQINGIVGAAADLFKSEIQLWGVPPAGLLVGGLTLVGVALVLAGGIRRIAGFSVKMVPLMGGLYCGLTLWLLIRNASALPQAVGLILETAVRPRAVAGAGLARVVQLGLSRGTFSHEAGMGSEAIAAAAAEDTTPHQQGLLSMLTPFFDTLLISTLTGLGIVVTGVWQQPGLAGAALPLAAFYTLPLPKGVTAFLLTLCLLFFGFSSIIGWSFYGEQSFCYLFPRAKPGLFRGIFLLALGVGIFLRPGLTWELADLCCALMTLPNLYGLWRLTPVIKTPFRGSADTRCPPRDYK